MTQSSDGFEPVNNEQPQVAVPPQAEAESPPAAAPPVAAPSDVAPPSAAPLAPPVVDGAGVPPVGLAPGVPETPYVQAAPAAPVAPYGQPAPGAPAVPAAPIGSAPPVAPAAPTTPYVQAAPAAPIAPGAPAAPNAPAAPYAETAPYGQSAPAAPGAPATPGAPYAQAAPAAPAPPSAPAATMPPFLRAAITPAGLATTGLVAGVAAVVALVSALLLIVAISSSNGFTLDAGQGLLGVLVGMGAVLGTGLSASVEGASFLGSSVDAGGSLTALALGTLIVVAIGVVIVARLRAAADGAVTGTPGAMIARSAIEAGAIALVLTLLTAIPALSFGAGVAVSVRSNGVATFFISFIVLGVALAAGRWSRRGSALPALGGFGGAAREFGIVAVIATPVFAVVALIGGTIAAASNDAIGAIGAALPFLGNATIALIGLAGFGGVTAGAPLGGSQLIMAGDIANGWGWLLPFVGLLVLIVAAIRVGVARGATATVRVARIWQLPVLALVAWILLAVSAGITLNASAVGFGGNVSIGLAWWTPLTLAVVTALISVAAEVLPAVVMQLAPGLFRIIAGKKALQSWGERATVAPGAAPAVVTDAQGVPLAQPVALIDGTGMPVDPASAPAAAVNAPVNGPVQIAPLSAAAKRGWIIGGVSALGAVVLIGGAIAAVAVINSTRGPETAVQAYVDALAKGDATQAASLVDPGVPNDERLLLSDEALQSADHLLTVTSVTAQNVSDGRAFVDAVMSVDGEQFTYSFEVAKGPNEMLVLDTWRVTTPMLTQIEVGATASDSVMLGDVEIPVGESADSFFGTVMWAYPGSYTLTTPETEYVTSTPATVRAVPNVGAPPAIVEEVPSAQLEELVLAAVTEHVTACATVPTNMDDACPYQARQDDLVSLTVTQQPAGFSEISMTDFYSEDAIITVQRPEFFGYTPDPDEVDFAVSGTITWQDGEPTVTVSDSGW